MDITIALQRASRNFEHGTAALAARLGMSITSLSHKTSPTYPGAHCSPEEMLELMQVTGDHGALHAMAVQLGYVLLPMPAMESQAECTITLASAVAEFGEFIAEAAKDLADGRVTDNERARIEREGAQALAAIERLLQVAARINREGKPNLAAVDGPASAPGASARRAA